MVKFRALFGESSRHKKGQTADLFTAHVLSISATKTVLSVAQNLGEDAKGNLKKHEKICQRPKKLHFCQHCAKQYKLNWLVIRHEKGCRDRPG
jgi:hypothetical protein